MAFRNDIYVAWEQSPRIIWVPRPSIELTVQDLHDTITTLQDAPEGQQFPNLISTAGGENLGGGVSVGLTATLLDAQVAFEPRFASVTEGTVTTQDTNGVTYIALAETFITDGVARGDVVHNHGDGSHATVLSVDSETQLTSTPLEGGSDNNYDIGDNIIISTVAQCNIDGGNIVATDDIGDPLNPVFPTYGTQVVRTSSSSATQLGSEKVDELWKLQGLDPDNPMTVTPTSRTVNTISQTISGDGETTTTVTRN